MRSEFPRRAAKALPSGRPRRDVDNHLPLIGLLKIFGQVQEIARVMRDSVCDVSGKLQGSHFFGRGQTVSNPVRAFMKNMFGLLKAANIGWRFAR